MNINHEEITRMKGKFMTFREELGFDITKVLLDCHNEKLKTLRKEFMDLLEKAYGLVPDDKKLKMADTGNYKIVKSQLPLIKQIHFCKN